MRTLLFTIISLIIISLFALTPQTTLAQDYAQGSCVSRTANGIDFCGCECPSGYPYPVQSSCQFFADPDNCQANPNLNCWCSSERLPHFTRQGSCSVDAASCACDCIDATYQAWMEDTCRYYSESTCTTGGGYCWCVREDLGPNPWPIPPYPDPPPDGGLDADCQGTNTGQQGICRNAGTCTNFAGEIEDGRGTCRDGLHCCVAENSVCIGETSGVYGDCILTIHPDSVCAWPRFIDGIPCSDNPEGGCCVHWLNPPAPVSLPIDPFQPSFCDPGEFQLRTGIGCLLTTPGGFLTTLYRILLFLAGGVTLLLMIIGSFFILTSQGQPERVKRGKEIFVGAVTGLVFFIFATFLLELIGVDILGLF